MIKPPKSFAAVAGLAALLAFSPSAASAERDVDTQQWTVFTLQKDLSKRWKGFFEVQPRFGSDISGVERLLVRPAIGYAITPKLSVWQGYGWTPLFMPGFRDEHRIFQQFLYEDRFGKTSFTNRLRFEERFIEDTGGAAFRIRNVVRASHPVSRDGRWSVIAYDELFWNLNTVENGPESGFDRNRTFLGVGRQVNKNLRVETGYLLELSNSPGGAPDRQLNIWLTSFNWKL